MEKQFKKIYIEITNICNLNCNFCLPDKRKKEFMEVEMFERILDKIKPYTGYIYLHVKGEPLLHPQINNIITLAKQKGFNINLTTNGTKIENLQSKEIRQLNYSMQSSTNIEEIRETIKKIRKYIEGTDIYVSLRMWTDVSKENKELQNMLKEEFKIKVLEDKSELAKNIFLSIEEQFRWSDGTENKENKKESGYCYGLKNHIAILVDGTVIPCCIDHRGEIALGNIKEESIEEILRKDRTKRIQEGFKERKLVESLCQNCDFINKF